MPILGVTASAFGLVVSAPTISGAVGNGASASIASGSLPTRTAGDTLLAFASGTGSIPGSVTGWTILASNNPFVGKVLLLRRTATNTTSDAIDMTASITSNGICYLAVCPTNAGTFTAGTPDMQNSTTASGAAVTSPGTGYALQFVISKGATGAINTPSGYSALANSSVSDAGGSSMIGKMFSKAVTAGSTGAGSGTCTGASNSTADCVLAITP